jgi:NitT/TauT family transport system permease protein
MRTIARWLPALGVFAALGLLWEWAANAGLLPVSLPAPSAVAAEFTNSRDVLWFHLSPTLSSAIRGYVVAAVTAFSLGITVAVWPRLAGPVYKTAIIVSSIPLIALTPVLVLWLDRGDAVRMTVAALAGFFPILVGFVQGFSQQSEGRNELFVVLSARPWQRFLRLTLPQSLPYVFAGLKVAAASSVLGAIIAEWTGGGGTRGLGQMMVNALFGFNVPLTWLTILTAALLSVCAFVIVAAVERSVVRWDHDGLAGGL